jgi:hypothetical protein
MVTTNDQGNVDGKKIIFVFFDLYSNVNELNEVLKFKIVYLILFHIQVELEPIISVQVCSFSC